METPASVLEMEFDCRFVSHLATNPPHRIVGAVREPPLHI